MNKKLELAQDRFIERIGNICNKFGLNDFIAQLYAVLYLSDRPLSLDELSQRLRASKGNVSINIRELEGWGAVRKFWMKGSRKDYYQAETDLKKILSERIKLSLQKHTSEISDILSSFKKTIESARTELTAEEETIAKVYEERLDRIEDLKLLAAKALSLADKFL